MYALLPLLFAFFVLSRFRALFFLLRTFVPHTTKEARRTQGNSEKTHFVRCLLLYVYCGAFIVFCACLSVCLLFAIFACLFCAHFYIFVQFCPIYIMCKKKVLLNTITFYSFLLFFCISAVTLHQQRQKSVAVFIYLFSFT